MSPGGSRILYKQPKTPAALGDREQHRGSSGISTSLVLATAKGWGKAHTDPRSSSSLSPALQRSLWMCPHALQTFGCLHSAEMLELGGNSLLASHSECLSSGTAWAGTIWESTASTDFFRCSSPVELNLSQNFAILFLPGVFWLVLVLGEDRGVSGNQCKQS